jgi:beta-phosphoglucomutase-like phosphatase (HAD superfamily)
VIVVGYLGGIFDVDGVLVDSPHERAWRESLQALMEHDWRDISAQTSYTPERFTPEVYQEVMAGMPRMSGARAALEYFGVPDPARRAEEYAARKQVRVVELIEAGSFTAFPDALRFLLAVKDAGTRIASASSSKNAKLFLRQIRLDSFAEEQGLSYGFVGAGLTLLDVFDADVTGRDFPRGKPDPMIFLTAAEELGFAPEACFVVEDATSGVQAAKAGRMSAIGVARLNDEALLSDAGADLVVTSLDDVAVAGLSEGRLERRPAAV